MRSLKMLLAAVLGMLALTLVMQPIVAQPVNPLAPAAPAEKGDEAAPLVIPPVTPEVTPALTATDVDAWLDGFMPYAIAQGDIAGAVVVVVKDGQVISQKGYGYADVAKRTRVDPARTLFRPGSVSKLVTWTAVMQLVEQGKIDLDADVNKYLDFKIPPYDGKPVTMRNIMQHTAGFEEAIKYLIVANPKNLMSLERYAKDYLPERIFAPGTTPAYSNYATSLAGYIVERLSGEAFDDYVDRHIFAPLGMTTATFRQPLPARLVPQMSLGYTRASEDPGKFEIVVPAPAGSLSASGIDMGRFMIAHLQKGQLGANRILSAATAEQMHNSPLTLLPPLNRMELGFFETNINGREVIAHLGDTQAFHTSLHLLLKENVGFYVSYNSDGREGASGTQRLALFDAFADRYFPGPVPTTRVPAKEAAEHARMMAGSWESSRRAQTNFVNALGIISQTKTTVGPKGELMIPDLLGYNQAPRKWVEIAPFVWKDANGHEMVAAKVENGKVVRWSFGLVAPFTVFDRAPWYKNSAWLTPLLYVSLAAILLTVLYWPIAWFVRRRFAAPLKLERRALQAHRLIRIADLASLLVLAGWATLVTVMLGDLDKATTAADPWIWLLQIASLIVFVGGFLVSLWSLWVTWQADRRWTVRLWSVVLAVASATLLWVGLAFHLIDFGTKF